MNREKKIIRALIFLLTLSSCFSVYALLAKKNTAAPVFLFMYDKHRRFLSEDSLSRPEFWDNYPYYVLISMHKSIHLKRYIQKKEQEPFIDSLLQKDRNLFYRFSYIQGQDSLYRHTFQSIVNQNHPVVVLTDHTSGKELSRLTDSNARKIPVVEIENLPIYLEKPKLSYFFRVSPNNTVVDLYVPRSELPEVTSKYITHVFTAKR